MPKSKKTFKIDNFINEREAEIGRFDSHLKSLGKSGVVNNVRFTISHCHGGVVNEAERLIRVIESNVKSYPNITVMLGFSGYAVSAAAFLFVYFTRHAIHNRIKVINYTPSALYITNPGCFIVQLKRWDLQIISVTSLTKVMLP
jgi:hypothetical protein